MHIYFTDKIIIIDAILALAIAFLFIGIIIYCVLRESSARKRSRGLVNIKKSVYDLILSGDKLSANVCSPLAGNSTSQQFLDVAMNRNSVFFNKAEQEMFGSCFADPKKIKKLEKRALKTHSKWRRIEAILSLSYLGNKNAPSIFKKSLRSRDEDIRYFSVIALGQIKNEESSQILVDLIKKEGFSKRKIVSILEGFPKDTTANQAIPLLDSPDKDVRFWTLKLLSRMDPGKYLPEISRLRKDASEEVRSAVCECLGNSRNKAAADAISGLLKDEGWLVRAAAARAMSELLGAECIPKIIGLLGDSSLSVLSVVKEILVEHIDAAMPYIEKVYSGEDRMAKMICVEAVEEAKRGKLK